MKSVGVRELKNRATQIVREVRENQAEYIVTVDGEPVAVLRPYEPADDADGEKRWAAWLKLLDAAAEEIGEGWPEDVSAVDAIREQRRWGDGHA